MCLSVCVYVCLHVCVDLNICVNALVCVSPVLHKCLPPVAPVKGDVDWDNKGGLDCV